MAKKAAHTHAVQLVLAVRIRFCHRARILVYYLFIWNQLLSRLLKA